MNSRSGSGGAPCSVTHALNAAQTGRCTRSYSSRNACQPDGSPAGYPEKAGGMPGSLTSRGLQDTIRTNGTPAVIRAGKQTTLSSTMTSGRVRSMI
jgi:hypothetical protein